MDTRVRLGPRTGAEELNRLALGERRDGVLALSPDPKQLPARDEQPEVGATLDERGEFGCRRDHLL